MRNFRTYHLAKELYRKCETLNCKGEIKNQLHRASLSVVLNLAEGSGKLTRKDRRRFYAIALGSTREVQAVLDLIEAQELLGLADTVAAHIWKLTLNPGAP